MTVNQENVSVVIPVFNRVTTVLDSLDGVLAQSIQPARVVVVDDGSTDGSSSSVQRWIDHNRCHKLVQLIRQSRNGVSVARNTGMAASASSDFIAFLDSDDIWPEDFIERTSQQLRESPNAVAVSCDKNHVSSKKEKLQDLRPLATSPTKWLFARGGAVLSCSLLRREKVDLLNGFKPDLFTGQDTDLLLRLSTQGQWLHCPGDPVVFQRELAAEKGEHGHLCNEYSDHQFRWVKVREAYVLEFGESEELPEKFYRRELARRWFKAAKQFLSEGAVQESRECLNRSLNWKYSIRAAIQLQLILAVMDEKPAQSERRTGPWC